MRYQGATPLLLRSTIHITVDPAYAKTYSGQVAAVTAASILGRMTGSIATKVPPTEMSEHLPWQGRTLDEVIHQTLAESHAYRQHESREPVPSDIPVFVGPSGNGIVVHGSGWKAYSGTAPSTLQNGDHQNPFGAAFAALMAAAQLQINPKARQYKPAVVDTHTWNVSAHSSPGPMQPTGFDVGEVWCIGAGSVGSCALFFLSLATQNLRAVIVDGDKVEVENITRSALFTQNDASLKTPKVEVAKRWLEYAGVAEVTAHNAWLHETKAWAQRTLGTPDIVIAAANEKNVRSTIETYRPPVQIYATTGKNWQVTLLQHIPMKGPCSLCVPGSQRTSAATICATAPPADEPSLEDDVALPFLSYAAGLMTAAEIAKLAITGNVAETNRVFFQPCAEDWFQAVAFERKHGCSCQTRDGREYQQVINGSRFAQLSS